MLQITPHMIAGAYCFLRLCPPFRGWRLPPGDEVMFMTVRDAGCFGYYQFKEVHRIAVVDTGVGHTDSLIKVVAHEMIHLHQYVRRLETNNTVHNANFRKLATRVCRIHGWDDRMFFM